MLTWKFNKEHNFQSDSCPNLFITARIWRMREHACLLLFYKQLSRYRQTREHACYYFASNYLVGVIKALQTTFCPRFFREVRRVLATLFFPSTDLRFTLVAFGPWFCPDRFCKFPVLSAKSLNQCARQQVSLQDQEASIHAYHLVFQVSWVSDLRLGDTLFRLWGNGSPLVAFCLNTIHHETPRCVMVLLFRAYTMLACQTDTILACQADMLRAWQIDIVLACRAVKALACRADTVLACRTFVILTRRFIAVLGPRADIALDIWKRWPLFLHFITVGQREDRVAGPMPMVGRVYATTPLNTEFAQEVFAHLCGFVVLFDLFSFHVFSFLALKQVVMI